MEDEYVDLSASILISFYEPLFSSFVFSLCSSEILSKTAVTS